MRFPEKSRSLRSRLALAVGALALALWGCQRAGGPRDAQLRIALESFPTNLDPRLATDAYSYDLIETLYNGLVRPAGTGGFEPDLAESLTQPDPRTFEITLKEGVHFHDGSTLSASDVLCTYRSVMDPLGDSPVRASFDPVQGIEVMDALHLRIRLREPIAAFRDAMTLPILPCALIRADHDFREAPVGTGFLKFVKSQPPSYIDLEPNEDYFRGKTRLPAVRFRKVPNPTTRVLSLMHGDIDLSMNNVSALYVDYLRKEKNLAIQTTPGTNFTYVGFNLKDPILKDVRVRRAIAYGIDREELVKYRKRGLADLAHAILPHGHWAELKDGPRYEYDPEKARARLDEAGYPEPDGGGPRLKLLYKTSQNKDALRNIEVMRQRLSQIGIEIEIQSYEWGTFFDQIKRGDFQLYSLSWIGVTDPDFYYSVFHSDQTPENGGRNRGRYSNPEVDRLFEQARTQMDQEKRAALYRQAQRILAEDLPYLPLWHERNVAIVSNRVGGFTLDTLASFRALESAYLKEAR